jgi:hypothetical protein
VSARQALLRRSLVASAALGCALVAQGAGRVAVVSEPQLGGHWLPGPEANRYVAGYPAAATDKSLDVCVAMGYLIGEDGATSDFVALDTWSSGSPNEVPEAATVNSYVQTAAAVVSMWRYLPAGKKPRPVYTATTFVFEGNKAAPGGQEQLRDRCRIGDLQAFIADKRNSAWRKWNERGNDRVRKASELYDRHKAERLGSDLPP